MRAADTSSTNSAYQVLLANAHELFELVANQEWEKVVERQAQLVIDLHRLKQMDNEPVEGERERLERRAIIKEFFQIEAKARAALMRRRDELREIIEGADRQSPNGYGGLVTGTTYEAADVFRNKGA